MSAPGSYEETIEYLRHYAADDWLSLSTVSTWAHIETGRGSTVAQILDMTLCMAADLVADGSPAGDLVADERGFVPWTMGADEQLARIRSELSVFVKRGEIPVDFDICWFHKIDL